MQEYATAKSLEHVQALMTEWGFQEPNDLCEDNVAWCHVLGPSGQI